MKKTLLGLGTLATIATPVAAIVSCTFEKGEDIRIQNKNFEDINNLSDAVDQAPAMEKLSVEIKDANKVGLLAGKEICKTELNERDNLVRFTYKDVPLAADESEDDSEGILEGEYPLVRITIQATDDPKIIRIERLSEDEESTKDVTSKEKKYFDEAKVTETIDKIKESIEETEKVRQIDATKVINVEESSLIGNNIITPASRIEDNSIILPSRIEDNSITLINNNAISQASVIEDNSITRIDGSNVTSGLQVLDPDKRMSSLFIKDRDGIPNSKHVTLSEHTLAISKEIRKIMNENKDVQWHTYGDGIIDGVNAVRLAIHDSLKGDNRVKELVREFADEPFAKWRGPRDLQNSNQYEEFCKMQINDWFDSKAGFPNLIGEAWGEMGKAGKANNWEGMKKAFRPTNIENMDQNTKYGALTLCTEQLLTAQHRAQELDWYGGFDGHGHSRTMAKIDSHQTVEGNRKLGEYSKAPTGDEGQGLENYVFSFTYNDHKFSEGADFTCGLLAAIDVLYDYADGGRETGHRTNWFGTGLTTLGYAWHAENHSNFQYLVTVAGVDRAPVLKNVDEIKENNPFLNKYTIEMLKYVTPITYLYKTCLWDKNNYHNLPGSWRDSFGKGVEAVFHSPHNSFSEFWEDIVKVIGEGNNAKTRYEEPTKMVEVRRFAAPQQIGKPDTWIKAYDYDGGGTLTGHQCGYSLLDPTIF